jgi:hypothetical protein
MHKIENVKSPMIGETYLVKCVYAKFGSESNKHWVPVFGELHHDKELYLEKKHYHIDWRFRDRIHQESQEETYRLHGYYLGIKNTYFYQPILEENIIIEEYKPLIYQRHFEEFPEHSFDELLDLYKGVKMQGMICPHKRANLASCEIINGCVTCPCHGLKWNVETGELVN